MAAYRVTKYNPMYRDREGRFLRDDWTSASEISSRMWFAWRCASYDYYHMYVGGDHLEIPLDLQWAVQCR